MYVTLRDEIFAGRKFRSRILAKFAKINSFFDPEQCDSRKLIPAKFFKLCDSRKLIPAKSSVKPDSQKLIPAKLFKIGDSRKLIPAKFFKN